MTDDVDPTKSTDGSVFEEYSVKTSDESLIEEFNKLFDPRPPVTSIDELWQKSKNLTGNHSPHALCLSGGGIRSATIGLGVLQGLAKEGCLEDFHYLSTVSGGGYIGSWLSRWRAEGNWSQEAMVETARKPSGLSDDKVHPIRRLRSFSNFLSPTWGLSLDAMTVFSIFLRNLLFNAVIWVLFVLATVMFFRTVVASYFFIRAQFSSSIFSISQEVALLIPIIAFAFWLTISMVLLIRRSATESVVEDWSRRAAIPLRVVIGWFILSGLFIYAPVLILEYLGKWELEAIGVGGLFLTIATGMVGYWGQFGPDEKKKAYGLLIGAREKFFDLMAILALVGVAFSASVAAHFWLEWWIEKTDLLPVSATHFWALLGTVRLVEVLQVTAISSFGLVILTVFFSWLVGANRFSLHSLYGNRLVRAYLGSAQWRKTSNFSSGFSDRDDIPMASLPGGHNHIGAGNNRLFHVVNMTLNLTRIAHHRKDWQERKAASFSATPLHCGSPHLGYAYSTEYSGKDGMTLGRAMTISGAAASPNMGYHSSSLMAVVMTFLNIRLGWWLPNPKKQIQKTEPSLPLYYLLSEAASRTSDDSDWLYLSDGAHFDNLGLYEMVRRRCRRIVVVDAGCDGEFNHSDLHNAARKIEVDFGIAIDLPATLPGQEGPGETQRIVVGRIKYSDADKGYPDGELYIIKPLLTGAEPPSLTNYAEISRRGGNTFPHHSTIDQFFNETQFESYRRLGKISAGELLDAMKPSAIKKLKDGVGYPLLSKTKQVLDPPLPSPKTSKDPTRHTVLPAPPEPVIKGIAGLFQGMQSLGPGALAATALTAVGTLSVVGTVGGVLTLKVADNIGVDPLEIDISSGAKKALETGIPIRIEEDVTAELKRLVTSVDELAKKIGPLGGGNEGSENPDLSKLVEEIGRLNTKLDGFPNVTVVGPNDEVLENINERLKNIEQDAPKTEPRLRQAIRELQSLSSKIDSMRSRQDARGR